MVDAYLGYWYRGMGGAWCGLRVRLILWSLQGATALWETRPALLWGLPLAGLVIAFLYSGWGKSATGGNNLFFRTISFCWLFLQVSRSAFPPPCLPNSPPNHRLFGPVAAAYRRILSPDANVFWGAFALKILLTAVTFSTGFKGGEVTPLFCIVATLGTTLVHFFHAPPAYFAALEFVAVFAGLPIRRLPAFLWALNFSADKWPCRLHLRVFCVFIFGHRGIYASQTVGTSKAHGILFARNTRMGGAAHAARIRLPGLKKQGKSRPAAK